MKIQWSKDSYYMPNNKETEGPIFNSEDKKQNISKSLIFPGNRTKWGQIKLMWRGFLISLWKWMIYIYHIFKRNETSVKRGLWQCIFCSNEHWLQCLSGEIYSFLARGLAVPILRQTNHISVTQKFYNSHWKLSTLKEHDNISPDHSLYIFSPIKFGQN